MINPDYGNLRSPAQVMDDLRLHHPAYLGHIHYLLDRVETLAQIISGEHDADSDVGKSFDALASAIRDLRADYLKPADRDLKEWERRLHEDG